MMMWQTALGIGTVGGIGLAVLVAELMPRHPKLSAALTRLGERESGDTTESSTGLKTRLGYWGTKHLSGRAGFKIPEEDLRILGQTTNSYFATRVMLIILLAIVVPSVLTVFSALFGFPLFVPLMTLASALPLGLLAVVIGDSTVKSQAADARREFSRAIATYIELVAVERLRGATTSVALEQASRIGSGWTFRAILEAIQQAKLAGIQPWTALEQLSVSVKVPDLMDVAHITRLSGEEGTAVYSTLRARGTALHSKILNEEHLVANRISERMTYPQSFLGVVFIAMIATPPLLGLLEI